LAIQQSLGSERDIALTTGLLSYYGVMEPAEVEEAIELCRQSLAILRSSGDRVAYSQILNIYGELVISTGNLVEARLVYEKGLAVALELEDRFRESMQLANLGSVDLQEGRMNSADLRLRRSLQIAMETEIGVLISPALDFLAWTAVEVGSVRRAAQLVGASEAVRMDLGILPQPVNLILSEQYVLSIREQLGEETFEALKAEGGTMTLQEAVSFALE
jgi:tetratricopeptide (TPR) repeat protein